MKVAEEERQRVLREIQGFASEYSHNVLGRDVLIVEQLLDFLDISRYKGGEEFETYCVRCKEKVTSFNGKKKTSDSGREMMQGNCPRCGTKVNRILGRP